MAPRLRVPSGLAVLLLSTASLAGPAPSPGRLVAVAPMATPRAAHTATALPDGDVLVVGGFALEEGSVGGAERYRAGQGRFEATGQPRVARQSHSATLLADGRVLIAGGYDAAGQVLASAELYEPGTGRFLPAGTLGAARAGHEAVLLADGRVLLVGGVGPGWSFLRSAELYEPRTGTFHPTGELAVPRESHAAVLLADGRVLVAGGHHGRGAALVLEASTELYQPSSGRFVPGPPMATRRHKHEAVALPDGTVLVAGGADERDDRGVYASAERFHPDRGRFRAEPPLLRGRYKHRGTAVLLPGGRLLLASGAGQAEVRELEGGRAELVPAPALLSGQFAAAAALPGGQVLLAGGYGGGRGPTASAFVYRPGP